MKVSKHGKKINIISAFEGKRYRKLCFESPKDAKYHGKNIY